jgi:hypothetical protein
MPRERTDADPSYVRHLRFLVAFIAALPLLTACSGADAQRAQQLMQQAQEAQKNVSSLTFAANLRIEAKGQTFGAKVTGGGYAKGRQAGDFFVDLDLSQVPNLPLASGHFRVVKRGSAMSVRLGDQPLTFPMPSTSSSTLNPVASFDIARYVKDVKVQGGQVVHGKPVTKIVGVLDTASLLQDYGKLDGYTQRTGQAIPSLDGHVGDTRIVAFVDDSTHLIVAALADVSAHGDGISVKLHFDYGLTSVNRPVAIPAA